MRKRLPVAAFCVLLTLTAPTMSLAGVTPRVENGRDGRIRTGDPLTPSRVLTIFQAIAVCVTGGRNG